jgi:DedD protein
VTNTPNSIDTPLEEEKIISKNANATTPQTSSAKQSLIDSASENMSSQEKSNSTNENTESSKAASKKGSLQTDPGEVIVNSQTAVSKVDNKNSKFILQVTALSSNDKVKEVTAKIKELKIPTYVIEKKRETPDSAAMYYVRAGPFASKEEAVSAEKKISALVGLKLSPTISEINK